MMSKPRILMFATGGTIFSSVQRDTEMLSYTTEGLQLEQVIAEAPSITDIADIETTTFCNIPSTSMTSEIWISLARTIEEAARRYDTTGIVITHGMDTLEETAFFLNLVLKTSKPIVLTGGMRPASAISADGPINLLDAVRVAASPEARGRGVLVVTNGFINSARDVTMADATAVNSFSSRGLGQLGRVLEDRVVFFSASSRPHTIRSQFSVQDFSADTNLPKVEIITSHADENDLFVRTCMAARIPGIVLAGCGYGMVSAALEGALTEAVRSGCVVVRSSRTGAGCVFNGPQRWQEEGFIPAGDLSAQKARILLQLSLNRFGNDRRVIGSIFDTY